MNSVPGSSSMSVMKDLTPAILSAAVGMMAGYSSVSAADTIRHADNCVHQQSQEDIRVAQEIHQFIKSCQEMEAKYRATVKDVSGLPGHELASILSPSELEEFTAHVQELRNVEIILKTFAVPDQFIDLHQKARKALAKGRSWVVVLHEMTLQAIRTPVVVPGAANPEGMKSLASHSTRRLVELARA